MAPNDSTSSGNAATKTVFSFIRALNKEHFEKARAYVNEDLVFVGVMGVRNGAEAYFKVMEK